MSEQTRMDGDKPSLRDWIRRMSDRFDIEREHLLFMSDGRDPMWAGTDGDYKKARWFARQYRRAVRDREDKQIHCRGVHYSIIEDAGQQVESPDSRTSWDTYRNTETCYGYLKTASVAARVLGFVPLDAIIDEKNDTTVVHAYGDHVHPQPPDLLSHATGIRSPDVPEVDERAKVLFGDETTWLPNRLARRLRMEQEIDDTSQHPFHIEVWSEKTIPGTPAHEPGGPSGIHRLAEEYGVNVVVEGEGDLSYTVARDLVARINAAGKPAIVLYLSDFDPKGDDMAAAMSGKLAWLKQIGELEGHVVVKQMAVTKYLIARYDLPRTPIDSSVSSDAGAGEKAYATLVSDWEERKGMGAVELQALWRDSDRFETVVREALDPLMDDTIDERTRQARQEWMNDIQDIAAEAVEESDLPNRVDALGEWTEDFNDAMDEAAERLQALQDLKDDDRYMGWLSLVRQVMDSVEAPEMDVPVGKADMPDSPLFDSDRSYLDNISEVRNHKQGDR